MFLGLLVAGNILFIGFLGAAYIFVGRRRWRIYLLVEHLATLARHGLPIHSGLRVVGRDLGGFLGSRVVRVAQRLEEGQSLSEALQAAPRTFPPLLRSMLALGEKSGNLPAFLEEMRRSYRRIADLPYQSVYLFIYPVLLSICINAGMAGIYGGLVPKFEAIFNQLKSTYTLLAWWPRLMAANEAVLVLCVTVVGLLTLGGTSLHFGSSFLRFLKGGVDRVVLFLPVIGGLLRDGAVQQFTLCTGLFLRSGATLAEATAASAEVERNSLLRRRLERMARVVAEGGRLSSAAREEGRFGDDALWFLETGEASGLLADHLLLASVQYETKARLAARLAVRAVVPLFILLNGLVVLGAFTLIFIPMNDLLASFFKR